jgi:hypothetical protein
MNILFNYIVPAIMIAVIIYCSFYTNALKDISNQSKKPYSFARSQLMWWTLLILPTISICYANSGYEFPKIDQSLLALLSIGAGTTVIGSLIDGSDIANGKIRQQEAGAGINFLIDILDDGNGISIHRLQALLFNILFGIIYINEFISKPTELPTFSPMELGLLGISAGSYLALKSNENSNPLLKQIAS